MNLGRWRTAWRGLVPFALPIALEAAAGAAWLADQHTAAIALLAACAMWQLVVVVRSRGKRSFLFHSIAFTLFAALAAGAIGGPRAAVLLLPAGLACLLVGLGIAHQAAVRVFAARSLPRRPRPVDETETTWRRDRAAIALALPTVLLALLLAPVAAWRFPEGGADAAPVKSSGGGDGSNGPVAPPPTGGSRPQFPAGGPLPFPPGAQGAERQTDDESYAGQSEIPPAHHRRPDSWRDRRVVMEVKPSRDGKVLGDVGPLYLRGLPVTQTGFRWQPEVPQLRSIADGDDGRDDGWCELAVRPAPGDRMDLAVHQELTVAAPGGTLVAFAPPGTAAVSLPFVRVEPGGVVLARKVSNSSETFDYRLVALTPSRVPFPGQIARLVSRDARPVAPSSSDAAAARLAVMAQTVVANVSSPVDRVKAVVKHLRDHFGYDEAGAPIDDPAALAKLLASRTGSCTQFAQAGVVMLRAIGIPARVGTGFLAGEWSPSKEAWVVRARDSHAWVEVAFEDCGWVIFDPTPREPPGAEDGRPEPGETAPPGDDSSDSSWDAPPPTQEGDGIEEVVGGVRGALARLFDWIRANPWPCAALAVAAAAVTARLLRRRARRLTGQPVDARPMRGPWDRLVTDLARRGHRRRAAQTASEFAAAVVASGGEEFAPLVALTARQQAARFGGRPLSPDDEKAIDVFRAAIRRRPSAA